MNKYVKIALLIIPVILIIAFVLVLTSGLYNSLINDIPFVSMLISTDKTLSDDIYFKEEADFLYVTDIPPTIEYVDSVIEKIDYSTQYGIINISSFETKDIPLYYGDTDEILANGAGQYIGSYACGHGGKSIVSANVMSYFYELEDTKTGDTVTVNTLYGGYEYEVSDKFVIAKEDFEILLYEEFVGDTLLLCTDYPRSKGISGTDSMIVYTCTLKRGKIYKNWFDE